MTTYILTDLIELTHMTIHALNEKDALENARKNGYKGLFYSIEVKEHKVNRWNINRSFV